MPEGDSLRHAAAAIGPHLVGMRLGAAWLRGIERRELAGRAVRSVEARGKHLLVAVEGGATVHVHLGMNGRVRVRPRAEATVGMARTASLLLATASAAVIVTRAPVAELLRTPFVEAHHHLSRLGPDLLDGEPDVPAMVRRARELCAGARAIADVLLDQRVAAGIGNVYKSEVLFIERLHPLTPLGALDGVALERLYRRAVDLMRANLGPWRRTTTADRSRGELPRRGVGRHFVYRRVGRPCYACGAPIETLRHGDAARVTYFCPSCQRG